MKKIILCIEIFVISLFFLIPPLFVKPEYITINLALSYNSIILLLISLLLFYQFEYLKSNKLIINSKKQFVKKSLICLLLLKLLTFFLIFIFCQLKIDITNPVEYQIENKFIFFISVFLNFLISAFFEECIYRLFLPFIIYNFFVKIYNLINIKIKNTKLIILGKILIELFSITIFALSHRYSGFINVTNAFFSGIILRYFAIKNKTILIGTVSHFLYNSINFILYITEKLF